MGESASQASTLGTLIRIVLNSISARLRLVLLENDITANPIIPACDTGWDGGASSSVHYGQIGHPMMWAGAHYHWHVHGRHRQCGHMPSGASLWFWDGVDVHMPWCFRVRSAEHKRRQQGRHENGRACVQCGDKQSNPLGRCPIHYLDTRSSFQ